MIVNVDAATFSRRFVDELGKRFGRDSGRGCGPAKNADGISARELSVIHTYVPFRPNRGVTEREIECRAADHRARQTAGASGFLRSRLQHRLLLRLMSGSWSSLPRPISGSH